MVASSTLNTFFKVPLAYAQEAPPPVVREYCSCVSYVRNFIPTLPHMDAVWFSTLPRSTIAPGRVAIFDYNGIWHVAYVTSLGDNSFTVAEGNFHKCVSDRREIDYNDPHLVGFWAP